MEEHQECGHTCTHRIEKLNFEKDRLSAGLLKHAQKQKTTPSKYLITEHLTCLKGANSSPVFCSRASARVAVKLQVYSA